MPGRNHSRQFKLECCRQVATGQTTDSAHALGIYLRHHLREVVPEAFCYLAAILDAYSRRCVGCRLSRQIDTSLTLSALEMALSTRRPEPGLIHYSDRGVQYASTEYVARLEEAGARISRAALGNPYENAKA